MMEMADKNFKLISKYALLLAVSYLLEFALDQYLMRVDSDDLTGTETILISAAKPVLTLLLNIVFAAIVYRDKVAQNIKTRYVILATVLYRPIGVVAFLLFSIYGKGTDEDKASCVDSIPNDNPSKNEQ
jgi:hypothetical protein